MFIEIETSFALVIPGSFTNQGFLLQAVV